MPRADQLPEELRELVYRNAVELTHARWDSDVEFLIKALKQAISVGPKPGKPANVGGRWRAGLFLYAGRLRLGLTLFAGAVLIVGVSLMPILFWQGADRPHDQTADGKRAVKEAAPGTPILSPRNFESHFPTSATEQAGEPRRISA